MLSVRQLAQKLGCSRAAVKRAIDKGMLQAKKAHPRLWMIEPDQRALSLLQARLDYLSQVRRQRAARMRSLWQQGKLRPRRRRQEQVVERLVRPRFVIIGEGAFARTASIRWEGDEGAFACPTCATLLRLKG